MNLKKMKYLVYANKQTDEPIAIFRITNKKLPLLSLYYNIEANPYHWNWGAERKDYSFYTTKCSNDTEEYRENNIKDFEEHYIARPIKKTELKLAREKEKELILEAL